LKNPSRKTLFLVESFSEFGYSDKIAGPFAAVIAQVLGGGNAVAVNDQLLAVRAGIALVLACETAAQNPTLKELASALPTAAIKAVARAIVQEEEDESQLEQTMEALASLADACGWALDATLAANCSMLLDVCENENVSASIKSLAMSVFASIMARKGGSASKDTAFATRTVRCILKMQVEDEEFEGDFDANMSPDEDDILALSQNGPRGSALDTLTQLAHGSAGITADANSFLMLVLGQVRPLLVAQDWRARVAALSTVSVIAAPLEKAFKPMLADVVGGASKMLAEDPHPRVRLTAAACIHTLLDASKKIGKEMRKSLHAVMIPTMAKALTENETKDAVSTRCAILLALCKFYGGVNRRSSGGAEGDDAEGGDDEDAIVVVPKSAIAPYMDGLVSLLVRVLQTSSQSAVQIRAMDALSALGTQAKTDFGKFYTSLVPGIKVALQQTQDPLVKSAAMILVATCAETVDKATFSKDAAEVVGWFLQRHHQQLANSASSKEETSELQGLFQFSERVASVLGADFAPFMVHLLPLVCDAAKADLGITISENVVADKNHVEQDETSGQATAVAKLRGVGQFEISANIYAFQLRESALSLMDVLAESGCVTPEHLDDCVNAVLPNISDRQCTAGLNVAAAEAAASLFNASCEYPDPVVPTRVLVAFGTPILAGLAFDSPTPYVSDEMDRRRAFAAAFERITRICQLTKGKVKPPPELLPHIIQVLMNAVSMSLTRRTNCFHDLKVRGFEPDMIQGFGEEIVNEETDLASDIVDSLGYLLKNDPQTAWPQYQAQVLPFMVGFLDQDTHGDANLTHNALCCFVDALEHGQEDPRVAQACVPNLKKALFSSEPRLRQVAAYGLGICAQKVVTGSNDWVEDVVRSLMRVVNVKGAKDESMILATENAVSALGKFYVRMKNNDILKSFVEHLPLVNDELEAAFAHELLFHLVLEQGVTGFDAHVVATCARIVQNHVHSDEEIELCTPEVFAKLPRVMATIRGRMGQEAMHALVMSFSSEEIDDEVKAMVLRG